MEEEIVLTIKENGMAKFSNEKDFIHISHYFHGAKPADEGKPKQLIESIENIVREKNKYKIT